MPGYPAHAFNFNIRMQVDGRCISLDQLKINAMRELIVTSTDTRKFSMAEGEKQLGKLDYTTWFTLKAELTLDNNKVYQVLPKGFWGTTIEVKDGEEVLFSFKMHWNGSIILKSFLDGYERDFIFKHKGLFKNAYVLLDKEEQELAVLQPDFKWSKFRYDYTISGNDVFKKADDNTLLFLTVVHCANYYMSMMSGGIGAAAAIS